MEISRGSELDLSPPRGHLFPIVGIGGSAGGLDAFIKLLHALPNDTDMAFVIVQHLDPHHTSHLPEILTKSTGMPVRNVEDGLSIRPNEVYVIPPNSTMVLEDGILRLVPRTSGLHLPVDAFFRSLARVQGGRAIGVILSGNASDGSEGVKAIKEECGITFAQDEATAQHIGMPRSAIATGAVDYVLAPADIARELARLSGHPYVRPQPKQPEAEILPEGNGELAKIFQILRARTRVDFSHYKVNTVRRRIGRRMLIKRSAALREYIQVLEKDPAEARELYRDLLISVTNFFRDATVFDALTALLKDGLASRKSTEAFRVWVPGCASGEELYSLAICLKELTEELDVDIPFQLFGTDISDIALDRARSATYPESIGQDVSPERLRRFFNRVDRGFQVSKSIRESCIFARQDVINDPPFGHMDLLSCRNLLIYLDSSLQRKILPVFHYSLNETGFLLLGSAESIGEASDLFSVVDKQNRIYARKPAPMRLTMTLRPQLSADSDLDAPKAHTTIHGLDLQKKADLVLQSKYSPPAVVIDGDFQILHFRGQTGFYLEPIPGQATLNLLRMAREVLVSPLRRVVESASAQNISIRETGIVVEHRGEKKEIALEATPVTGAAVNERYFVVAFQEGTSQPERLEDSTRPRTAGSLPQPAEALEISNRDLERHILELREQLRNANEDHEAHVEELRASNEEVRSANEELQSTNEELSTTKEELQSANEELTTLNEELQTRNIELNTANSDLGNLLTAVDIPFLMLDNDLRLRRFSDASTKLLKIQTFDVGHSISGITGSIDPRDLVPLAQDVLDTLHSEEREIQDQTGHWHNVCVRPYRTLDNRIDGVVIILFDIDALKRTLQAAEEARDYAEGLIETVREPLIVLDADLRINRATSAFYETFRVSRAETEGRFLYDVGSGQWNLSRLRELLGEALFRNHSFEDLEIEHTFPHIGRRRMRLNGKRISPDGDRRRSVLLAIEDVTERHEQAEIRYQRMFETAKDGMVICDAETEKIIDVNPFLLELIEYRREQVIGRSLGELEAFQTAGDGIGLVADAAANEIVRRDAVSLRGKSGRIVQTEIVANRYVLGTRPVVQINIRDVTERHRAELQLKEQEHQLRASLAEKDALLKEIHHRVKNNLQIIASLLDLQSEFLDRVDTKVVLEEMKTRVRSIAAIHELLYTATDFSRIEFRRFVDKLVQDVIAVHRQRATRVRVKIETESALLEMAQAVPCGLIVNELLTNALKHAFPEGRQGNVKISFGSDETHWRLEVSDDGIGLPADVDLQNVNSMGLQLIQLLVQQLNGSMNVVRDSGTQIAISFPQNLRSADAG
ncbi:MAG TPA: chemotaxis protein CheB [Terracidiphilus sp.]|nr:chemotaxis protein CheB [Terracidiphilus sp.]